MAGLCRWLARFFGVVFGGLGREGYALETDVRELAMELHDRVRQGAMTVAGATALLEASRPPTRCWAARRARRVNRTLDVWLARFDEVQILVRNSGGDDDRSYDLEPGTGGAE